MLGVVWVLLVDFDVRVIDVKLICNGEVVVEGCSDVVLGNLVIVVVWLVGKVESFGVWLCKGDIVLFGLCMFVVEVWVGDEFVVDFIGLGLVWLLFE